MSSFFFSSRRRHTRCLSDWSSDVCSSDLPSKRRLMLVQRSQRRQAQCALTCPCYSRSHQLVMTTSSPLDWRSEERRVGKGGDVGGGAGIKNEKHVEEKNRRLDTPHNV